jgi:hypothetical protein
MIYINYRYRNEVETVDEVDQDDFKTYREFAKYVRYLVNEYRMSGMDVYTSQRACNHWFDR